MTAIGLIFRGVILIVTLHPIHDLDFIAAFRGDIEVDENCVHLLVAAGIAGIRVEDFAGVILAEDAEPWQLIKTVFRSSDSCNRPRPSQDHPS